MVFAHQAEEGMKHKLRKKHCNDVGAAAAKPEKKEADGSNAGGQQQLQSLHSLQGELESKGYSVTVNEQGGGFVFTVSDGKQSVSLPAQGLTLAAVNSAFQNRRAEGSIGFDPNKKPGGETPAEKAARVQGGLKNAGTLGGSVVRTGNAASSGLFGQELKDVDKAAKIGEAAVDVLMAPGRAPRPGVARPQMPTPP
jgi:hypothetical protein